MATKYENGFIDKSILIKRNMATLTYGLSTGLAVKSCIQSIFKLVREHIHVGRLFFTIDTKPYHKSSLLKTMTGTSEYKADRPKDSSDYYKVYCETSYALSIFANKFGITNLKEPGWESDDIAYLMAKKLESHEQKSVLISFDGDWNFIVNPNVDYFNMRHRRIYTYEECCKHVKKSESLHLMDSMILRTSFKGSHNNLKQTIKDEYLGTPTAKLYDIYLSGEDYIFTDKSLFEAQLATWRFEEFPGYDNVMKFYDILNKPVKLGTVDEFREFRKKYDFNIPAWRYKEFMDNIDLNRFKI